MATRRLHRLLLGAPTTLRNIDGMEIAAAPNSRVANEFIEFFVPSLRYSNPSLRVFVHRLRPREATASSSPPSSSTSAEDEGATKRTPSTPKEYVALRIVGSKKVKALNLGLYRSPHQLMQRILDVDAMNSFED